MLADSFKGIVHCCYPVTTQYSVLMERTDFIESMVLIGILPYLEIVEIFKTLFQFCYPFSILLHLVI